MIEEHVRQRTGLTYVTIINRIVCETVAPVRILCYDDSEIKAVRQKEEDMGLSKRKDVPVNETWDLSLIYKEESQMWDALEKVKADVKTLVETYQGKLTTAEMIVG